MKQVTHIITTIERGGAEKQLLILVREQIRAGFRVEIIPLKGAPELMLDFQETGAVVNINLLGKNFFRQLLAITLIVNQGSKIIHAHLPKAELTAALTSFRNPFVVTRHNAEQFFPKAPATFSAILSKFVVIRSKGLIAISDAVLKYLFENSEILSRTKCQTIHYGYSRMVSKNNESELVDEIFRRVENNFVIGTVGRLAKQKNYLTLLESFKIVSERIPNSRLVIIGDGPLRKDLHLFAEELGVSNRIIWVGRVPDVEKYYTLFDVFLLASEYEGFGLVLLEAMDFEVPIVAADNSAIPEVLGREYVHLCRTHDAAQFAESTIKIFEGRDADMTKKYLQERLRKFSPQIMSQKTISFYENIFPNF